MTGIPLGTLLSDPDPGVYWYLSAPDAPLNIINVERDDAHDTYTVKFLDQGVMELTDVVTDNPLAVVQKVSLPV